MIKIFDDDLLTYIDEYKNDIIDALKYDDITVNDENIQQQATAWIDADAEYLKDIITHYDNFNNDNNKIYIDADLGLWYGRRKANKITTSLYNAIFSLVQDTNKLYFVRNNSTLTLQAIHHDGTNYFRFYKLVNGKKHAITYDSIYNI